MLLPNKIISLNESSIYRAAKLLSLLKDDISFVELYKSSKRNFSCCSEFIDALDLLFVLEKITLDKENEVIKIA